MGECFKQLDLLSEEICRTYQCTCSYDVLRELHKNGTLNYLLYKYNIDNLLYNELIDFANILNSNYFYYTKYKLYYHNFMYLYSTYGYMLCLHFNNLNAYRLLPLFFLECAKYYKIDRYCNYTYEQIKIIFDKLFELEYRIHQEYNDICERPAIQMLNKDKYKEIIPRIERNEHKISDDDDFFVYSEYYTNYLEKQLLRNENLQDVDSYVDWVSKDYGDGYGYDIHSYDYLSNNEKLIEVKSGKVDNIYLTLNEYKVANESRGINNSDYYVYKYIYKPLENKLELLRLKLDKNTGLFINIDNYYDQYMAFETSFPDKDYNPKDMILLSNNSDMYKNMVLSK